jgi:dihydroorotase
VARDLALVRLTGARLHLLHLSTRAAVALVAAAKAEGLPVTAEATPHHLVLTDAALASFDPVFKVNPPLREDADVAALREALASGVVDAVATDHAPHPPEAKDEPLETAPPGMLGLETALALCHSELCASEAPLLTPGALFARLSAHPARIAGLPGHGGPVAAGRPAHLCVFDPSATWVVDPRALASRSRNTPFAGRRLTGRVRHTVVAGEAVVVDGEAQR